jgi:hypothetical protein
MTTTTTQVSFRRYRPAVILSAHHGDDGGPWLLVLEFSGDRVAAERFQGQK